MTLNLTHRRKEPSVWFSVGCDSPQRSMEVRLPAAARSTVSTDSSWQASLTYASLTVHRARPGVSRPGPWPYDRTCDVQHTTQDAYAERSDNSSCAHGSESRNFVFVLAGLCALVNHRTGFTFGYQLLLDYSPLGRNAFALTGTFGIKRGGM